MKNRILNIIIQKAVTQTRGMGSVEELKKRLETATGASPQRMTKILHNQEQPTEHEQTIVADILKVNKEKLFEPLTFKEESKHL